MEEEVKLGFIRLIGEETDGYYRYEFIFTNNIDEFWGENFEYNQRVLLMAYNQMKNMYMRFISLK